MNELSRRGFLARLSLTGGLPFLLARKGPEGSILSDCRTEAIALISSGAVPSVSVAVLQDGRNIWAEAFGWSDREKRIPADRATRYAIASASKPFTATALLMLVEQGRIDLDAPLTKYLGGLPLKLAHPISVRETLQHRSGIPRHWRNAFRGQGSPPVFEDVARKFAFSTAAAGRRYLYSNLNYGLLAHAIASVTAQPFGGFFKANLLSPLGLHSVGPISAEYDAWQAATPYEDDGSPIPPFLMDETGARDLVMTAGDLAMFGEAHRAGHPILSAGLRRTMIDQRVSMGFGDIEQPFYGLGWMGEEDTPASVFSYGHSGEGPGAAAQLTIVPGAKLVVATMANVQGAPAYALNRRIVDALVPAAAARRSFSSSVSGAGTMMLDRFAGQWSGVFGTSAQALPLKVKLGAEGSWLSVAGGPQVPLTRIGIERAVLAASADARLPDGEAARWPHTIRCHLERLDGHLEGTVAAYAPRGTTPGAPPHDQFWLSFPVRLSRI